MKLLFPQAWAKGCLLSSPNHELLKGFENHVNFQVSPQMSTKPNIDIIVPDGGLSVFISVKCLIGLVFFRGWQLLT